MNYKGKGHDSIEAYLKKRTAGHDVSAVFIFWMNDPSQVNLLAYPDQVNILNLGILFSQL